MGVVVGVVDDDVDTVPSALMYSYIESLFEPPQISVLSPLHGKEQPAEPSGAGAPPLSKELATMAFLPVFHARECVSCSVAACLGIFR